MKILTRMHENILCSLKLSEKIMTLSCLLKPRNAILTVTSLSIWRRFHFEIVFYCNRLSLAAIMMWTWNWQHPMASNCTRTLRNNTTVLRGQRIKKESTNSASAMNSQHSRTKLFTSTFKSERKSPYLKAKATILLWHRYIELTYL